MRWMFSLLFSPAVLMGLLYEVEFEGLDDVRAIRAMRDVSQLVSLQKRPPASINGLRYRMAADLPELLRTLHAFSYYEASITTDLQMNGEGSLKISLFIRPGSPFTLASYDVYHGDCKQSADIPLCHPLTPERLGLRLGQRALSTDIVNAELQLLTELSKCGYPLAYVDKRRVEVDMADHTVQAASCIQEGPLAKFGASTFFGLKGIKPQFIDSKIRWKEGEIYDANLIESTQERLLKSELFSSVYISHGDALNEQGELPIRLRFTEARHRRITLGAFYGTVDGPGFTFSWIHRNIGGMGDVLSIKGDASKHFIAGNLTYKKPDFLTLDQTLRVLGEISQENIRAYSAFIYRAASYLDRKIDVKTNLSIGLKAEHINVWQAASRGAYLLMGIPLFVRHDNADDFLDPGQGFSIIYSATPYQSLLHGSQQFIKQRITGNFYIPFHTDKRFVLALKAQLGSISGTKPRHIPMTKLFLGGSENDLRGYRYKTVSPLNAHRKPLGGRAAIFTTVEGRIKITKTIGVVPFADFGTVSVSSLPKFDMKWFKSVGAGLRYFTFFGPLRFDVGFPLNKRKGIDPNFQIYASVGQTF